MFDPLRSDRPLIVYVDYKSPYAFIAKDPTCELAAALGAEIDWRPLTLDIPSYLGSARLDARGEVVESRRSPTQWSQVRYAYRDARRYANLRGLTLRGTTKIWDTALAGMGMLWAKAQSDSVLRRYSDRIFERFWRREIDVEDVAAVESVLAEAGADPAGFRADALGAGRARYEEMQRRIFDAGVFGVPGYVVEGEYYWGREHLPRIRWILGGRRGPAPDVAYREPRGGGAPTERVAVCVDFKSPQAYLALEPTRALEARLGVRFDWRPLIVPALTLPRAARAADDRGARHRRMRSEYLARDLARYAAVRGLELGDVYRSPDTALASLGLLYLRRRAPSRAGDYVGRVFELVWKHGADVADPAVVEKALGADASGFRDYAASDGPRELAESQGELAEAGALSVPAYLLHGEVFLGRQHLPMVEWLLGGRTGAPPI